ncbi:hypothetical protein MKW92_040685, partial [Papaver armeniacum]
MNEIKLGKEASPLPGGIKLKLNKGKLLQLMRNEELQGQGMDLNKSPVIASEEITNQVSVINSKGIVINQIDNPTKSTAKGRTTKGKYAKARKARME